MEMNEVLFSYSVEDVAKTFNNHKDYQGAWGELSENHQRIICYGMVNLLFHLTPSWTEEDMMEHLLSNVLLNKI